MLLPGNVIEGVQRHGRVEVPVRERDRPRVCADKLGVRHVAGRLPDLLGRDIDSGHAVGGGKFCGHGNTGRAPQVEDGRTGRQAFWSAA
jgi:hypothetical protein